MPHRKKYDPSTTTSRYFHARSFIDRGEKVPASLSVFYALKEQALEAFRLRNEIKLKAREMMKDQSLANTLPPAMSLEDVTKKAYNKNYIGDSPFGSTC